MKKEYERFSQTQMIAVLNEGTEASQDDVIAYLYKYKEGDVWRVLRDFFQKKYSLTLKDAMREELLSDALPELILALRKRKYKGGTHQQGMKTLVSYWATICMRVKRRQDNKGGKFWREEVISIEGEEFRISEENFETENECLEKALKDLYEEDEKAAILFIMNDLENKDYKEIAQFLGGGNETNLRKYKSSKKPKLKALIERCLDLLSENMFEAGR